MTTIIKKIFVITMSSWEVLCLRKADWDSPLGRWEGINIYKRLDHDFGSNGDDNDLAWQ